MEKLVVVDLKADERGMLRWGLGDWGGPASATESLARLMGFTSVRDLVSNDGRRISAALRNAEPLSRLDWTRALVATELVWASEVFGSGVDSFTTFGVPDEDAIEILRSTQRRLTTAGVVNRGLLV